MTTKQSGQAYDCLKWIADKYDITFNDKFGIVDLVFEYMHECSKINKDDVLSKPAKNHNGQNKISGQMGYMHCDTETARNMMNAADRPKVQIKDDLTYIEEKDENGRIWYTKTGGVYQSHHKLRPGDAIIYKAKDCQKNDITCFLIVDDLYDSDFSAYAYLGELSFLMFSGVCRYNHFPIEYESFSFATTKEIIDFFKNFTNRDSMMFLNLKDKHCPAYMQKYKEYFKHVPEKV